MHAPLNENETSLTVCEDARTLATIGGLFCSVPAVDRRAVQRKPSPLGRGAACLGMRMTHRGKRCSGRRNSNSVPTGAISNAPPGK
jgi:hypothetical protein